MITGAIHFFNWFLIGISITLGYKFALVLLAFIGRVVDRYVLRSTL